MNLDEITRERGQRRNEKTRALLCLEFRLRKRVQKRNREGGNRKVGGKPEKVKSIKQSCFQLGETALSVPSLHAGKCSPSQ